MKNLMKFACVALISVGLSSNLYAGKSGGVTGTVSLVNLSSDRVVTLVDGQETDVVPASWPTYGDDVGFEVTVDGRMDKNSILFVSLTCYTGGSAYYHHSEVAPSNFIFNLAFDQLVDQSFHWSKARLKIKFDGATSLWW